MNPREPYRDLDSQNEALCGPLQSAVESTVQRVADDSTIRRVRQRAYALKATHVRRPASWFRETVGFARRYKVSLGASCAVGLLIVVGIVTSRPSSVMGQVAAAVKNARSCRFEILAEMTSPPSTNRGGSLRAPAENDVRDDAKPTTQIQRATAYWQAPHSYRLEVLDENQVVQVNIDFRDRPGLNVDNKRKEFRHTKPHGGQLPMLMLFHQLERLTGKADRRLGTKQIGEIEAEGYEIATRKIMDVAGQRRHNRSVGRQAVAAARIGAARSATRCVDGQDHLAKVRMECPAGEVTVRYDTAARLRG